MHDFHQNNIWTERLYDYRVLFISVPELCVSLKDKCSAMFEPNCSQLFSKFVIAKKQICLQHKKGFFNLFTV